MGTHDAPQESSSREGFLTQMQCQPELPRFAAPLCGIPAEAVAELNLSLRDWNDLGGLDTFICVLTSKGFYLAPETMHSSSGNYTVNCKYDAWCNAVYV